MRAALLVIVIIAVVVTPAYSGAIKGRAGDCSFSVTGGLGDPQPLILTPGSTNFFRSSDTKGTLSFSTNEAVLLACPGSGNYLTVSVVASRRRRQQRIFEPLPFALRLLVRASRK